MEQNVEDLFEEMFSKTESSEWESEWRKYWQRHWQRRQQQQQNMERVRESPTLIPFTARPRIKVPVGSDPEPIDIVNLFLGKKIF